MTLTEFIKKTKDLPEDTPIVTTAMDGSYYEPHSIEILENQVYWDEKNNLSKATIIVI